jgi:hypothetical protein
MEPDYYPAYLLTCDEVIAPVAGGGRLLRHEGGRQPRHHHPSYNRMLWTALRGKAAYLPG